jgi:hypothetical protein
MTVPALMTLRSGAAAALSSAYQCLAREDTPINTNSDLGGIDPVLGDEQNEELDRWLRVAAWPAMMITYTPGNSNNPKPYYFIRKEDPIWPWTDIEGWLIYDKDGSLVGAGQRRHILEDSDFINEWTNNAVAFYGIYSRDGLELVEESEIPVALAYPVPESVVRDMRNSSTMVYLLAYYDEGSGAISYYPMPPGDALLITGSCLCSIDPLKFQRYS